MSIRCSVQGKAGARTAEGRLPCFCPQPGVAALQFPPAVADMFCPDRDFLRAGRAGHEHDGRGGDSRVHQQREEDRRQDLENLEKMLENIGKPKLSFPI